MHVHAHVNVNVHVHMYMYVHVHVHVHVRVHVACLHMHAHTTRYVEWAKQAGIMILPTWQEYVVCMGDKVDELTKVIK